MNRAEALYGLGQYDRAKEAFEQFLKEIFLESRLAGELTYPVWVKSKGRKTASGRPCAPHESGSIKRSTAYPFSAGATLARLRLLPCEDHGGFDAEDE